MITAVMILQRVQFFDKLRTGSVEARDVIYLVMKAIS